MGRNGGNGSRKGDGDRRWEEARRIVEKHRGWILACARRFRRYGPYVASDDVEQMAYLCAFGAVDRMLAGGDAGPADRQFRAALRYALLDVTREDRELKKVPVEGLPLEGTPADNGTAAFRAGEEARAEEALQNLLRNVSRAERRVLRAVMEGEGRARIASRLGVRQRTVRYHINNTLRRIEMMT